MAVSRKAKPCTAKVVDCVSNPPSHGIHGNHTETRKIKRIIEVMMYIAPPSPHTEFTETQIKDLRFRGFSVGDGGG